MTEEKLRVAVRLRPVLGPEEAALIKASHEPLQVVGDEIRIRNKHLLYGASPQPR